MSDLIDRNEDDYVDLDPDAVLFSEDDGELRAERGSRSITRSGAAPLSAWRRLEQLREERFLRQCLREVYDD